jgi:beta-lactam-binding protein with PASTA domain
MPTRLFAITATRDTVTLDGQGHAEASFTASNTSPKSIAGRAKLVPLGSTQESWLSLEGEQERNFAKEEAHQFTVKLAIPPGTPPGKYSFRLDIISVENPDDEFTEGPAVSFEVKKVAPTPAAPSPLKFPWWIVAVVAVLVIGAGVITWLLLPQKVKVPQMVGMPSDEAIKSLEAAKLKLAATNTKATGTQKVGIVVEQSPNANQAVPVGSGVTLVVEGPPTTVVVPNVVGQPISKAKELLKGFAVEEAQRITGKSHPGLVVEQIPAMGANVPPGTKVSLIVEAQSVAVPKLIGLTTAEVEPLLKNENLQLKSETKSARAGAKPGTIVDQNPKPGSPVAAGTVITAFVEPEPEMVTVPDVVGVPLEKVGEILQGKLAFQVNDQRVITGKVPVGTIASQSPAAGQRVPPGTKVALSVEGVPLQVVPGLRR